MLGACMYLVAQFTHAEGHQLNFPIKSSRVGMLIFQIYLSILHIFTQDARLCWEFQAQPGGLLGEMMD